jgi:acyl-CoA thioesterase-1
MALVLLAPAIPACAEQITIVALGASNTQGYGVDTRQAFPTQLETLLRQKGYDVRVLNAGIPGDRTSDMLARLDDWVPRGTKLVFLQAGTNDARTGVSAEKIKSSLRTIEQRLAARGTKTILVDPLIGEGVPKKYRQADDIHYKAEGHALVASRLLQPAMDALGAPRL